MTTLVYTEDDLVDDRERGEQTEEIGNMLLKEGR